VPVLNAAKFTGVRWALMVRTSAANRAAVDRPFQTAVPTAVPCSSTTLVMAF
jgi:hypothetical protein